MKYNPKQVKFTQKRLILPVLGATSHIFQGGDIYFMEVISKTRINFYSELPGPSLGPKTEHSRAAKSRRGVSVQGRGPGEFEQNSIAPSPPNYATVSHSVEVPVLQDHR